MRRSRELILRFGGWFNKQSKDRKLDEEIESHLQFHFDDNLRLGMRPEEARREVMMRLGGIESTKEAYRDQCGLPALDTLWQDIHYGTWMLRKSPGFTIVAVFTIGLGVGLNTAMFTIFNSLLFRPVPLKEPQSVVRIHTTDRNNSFLGHLSYPDYEDIRDQSTTLAGLAASAPARDLYFEFGSAGLGAPSGPPEKVRGALVSGNYFEVLGGGFSLGRGFAPFEDRAGGTQPVAVLSHGFWEQRLGADSAIVGQILRLNDIAFTVVGVTSPDFRAARFDQTPDIWIALPMQPRLQQGEDWLTRRDQFWLQVDGRLRRGVSLETAQTEIEIIAKRLAENRRGDNSVSLALRPGTFLDAEDRQKLKPAAGIAMTAVGFITLIAGANLANLLLFRAVSRRREIAVRLSLGASRARFLRQLMTENALLAAFGAAVSLLLAFWLADALTVLAAGAATRSSLALSLDWRVTGYALLIAGITVFGFGLAPVLQAAKQDVSSALRDETGGITPRMTRCRLRNVLVGGQIALSLFLLVCSGLMIRTVQRGLTLGSGIEIKETIAVSLDLARHGYNEVRAAEFKRLLIERLAAFPNVRAIAQSSAVPLQGVRNTTDFFTDGRESAEVLAENHISAFGCSSPGLLVAGAEGYNGQPSRGIENRVKERRSIYESVS